MAQQIAKDERSIGELFSDLTTEAGTLIRQEIALAQTEMVQKATKIGTNLGFVVIGGAVAFAALLAIIAAVIIVLGHFISLWLSALIVGVILAIIGAILISTALKSLKETDLKPKETIATVKEDAEWLKEQI